MLYLFIFIDCCILYQIVTLIIPLRIGIYKSIISEVSYKISSEGLYSSFSYYLENIIQST